MSGSGRPSRIAPLAPEERAPLPDILRGLAILGILVENIAVYGGRAESLTAAAGPIDRVVILVVQFVLEAKSYMMLSFLFGWGVAAMMTRAREYGARFVPLYLRRLSALLVLGVLHGTLIWYGDILTLYALTGLVLLTVRRRSQNAVLIAGVCCMLLPVVLSAPGPAMDAVRGWLDHWTEFLRDTTFPQSLYSTGMYADITRRRIQDYLWSLSRFPYSLGGVLGMALFGLYAGRRRILQKIQSQAPSLRSRLWPILSVALLINAVLVASHLWSDRLPLDWRRLVQVGARTTGGATAVFSYILIVALLLLARRWRERLSVIADVGRMSLSHYLAQSVVCTLLMYNYGLGLYGKVGPTFGPVIAAIIYSVQKEASVWWLGRFRLGPVEWVWRSFTYGHWQILRLGAAPEGSRRRSWFQGRRLILISVCLGLGLTVILASLLGPLRSRSQIASSVMPQTRRETAVPAGVSEADAPADLVADQRTVATPEVHPVPWDPGPAAALGDLTALASAFDPTSALSQVEALTGPPFLGRYAGSPQGWAAADYLAEQFRRYGLQPAGDEGSFYQRFPLEYVALVETPTLALVTPSGATHDRYVPYRDFSAVLRWYSGSGATDAHAVWANSCDRSDFDSLDAVGKVVLCKSTSIQDAQRNSLEHGGVGLLVLTDPAARPPDFGSTHFEPWIPNPIPTFRVFPDFVGDLLEGSGKSVLDLSSSFESFPLRNRVRMEVNALGREACPEEGCRGRSVLGVLPGRDPKYAEQVVIIGAHYDHLGQSPDGTVWPGANDDASGVAVLLEIAHSWHEQGYVPRRTVLFAAWDAEELGLLGSRHYVEHPRYPLESTVAMIQLDMVGDGGDVLRIDGGGELGAKIQAIAGALDVQTAHSDAGRSDHVPFAAAGVPASLLIWAGGDESPPLYHRPVDTVETIDPGKLEAVGKVAAISALAFTEAEPALDDLLAARAMAVERGDLDAFLATSIPAQEQTDRLWFSGAQMLSGTLELRATDIRVLGRTATATVHMTLERPDGGGKPSRSRLASTSTKFAHGESGWQWAGPNLTSIDPDAEGSSVVVVLPPENEEEGEGIGRLAADRYEEMTALLGLPAQPEARLMLYPDAQSLRASTSLSLLPGARVWVGPGTARLVYSPAISTSLELADALAQLVLANAGVTPDAAPWLWEGLPLVLRAHTSARRTDYLPALQALLADPDGNDLAGPAASWGAVEHLRLVAGWDGLGELIALLGQEGLDAALQDVLQMDRDGFSVAWQASWRTRLVSIQDNLDAVLSARTEAILAGDEGAFLDTVDGDVPRLEEEEREWLAALEDRSVDSLSLAGQPLALLGDGSVLAAVSLEVRFADGSRRPDTRTVVLDVRFTPRRDGYLWAGSAFEELGGSPVRVLYPSGQEDLAQALLRESEAMYGQLAATLRVAPEAPAVVKLYDHDEAFRSSISPSMPNVWRAPAWTSKGTSVKLLLGYGSNPDAYRSNLALCLARHLLSQMGVESEWLLRGMSIYLSRELDGGEAVRDAENDLGQVAKRIAEGDLVGIGALRRGPELSENEIRVANSATLNLIQYLTHTTGQQALFALLHSQSRGIGVESALQATVGLSLEDLGDDWSASLLRAHIEQDWLEIARAFDPERANHRAAYLAGPGFAGRQAGTPGAEAAANYVAEEFAALGLVPVGEPDPLVDQEQRPSFLQHFAISSTVLLAAPRLEFRIEETQTTEAFVYRRDFVTALDRAARSGGVSDGDLVWIADGSYQGIALGGKIAVRLPEHPLDIEVARAIEHGAGGLLLVGKMAGQRSPMAKHAPLASPVPTPTIPVLELTQPGFLRLLEIAGHTRPSIADLQAATNLGLEVLMEVQLDTEDRKTANVLGVYPGSDPDGTQEVIILGAHYDHVGDDLLTLACPPSKVWPSNEQDTDCAEVEVTRYPGSNDNASGVAVLLEIAHLWRDRGYQPRRSVLFAAWGAQELNELGSTYYTEHPAFPLERTVATLHLDSVGGGKGFFLEAQGTQDADGLLRFVVQAVEEQVDGRLSLRQPTAQGDHVPFRQAGIPTLQLTWREASEDNWPEALADPIQPYRLGVAGRMTALTLMGIAR